MPDDREVGRREQEGTGKPCGRRSQDLLPRRRGGRVCEIGRGIRGLGRAVASMRDAWLLLVCLLVIVATVHGSLHLERRRMRRMGVGGPPGAKERGNDLDP